MSPKVRVAIVAVILLAGAGGWWFWGRKPGDDSALSGYIEGEALYLSPLCAKKW